MVDVISFEEAIRDSRSFAKRHLLLGNGFSIACCPDIFHYGSLFEEADFSANPKLEAVFEALETQDFEVAIRHLEAGSSLVPIYAPGCTDAAAEMAADALALKDILLTTIAANHPDVPGDIPDEKFWACRQFLNYFIGPAGKGQIFTLNYDLLLYWTLMHDDDEMDTPLQLNANDGFGNDEDDPDADYVVWQGETGAHDAKIHFLHGALHLFDAGNELQKFTWVRTTKRLVDQARSAISNDKFPLFVAEGSSAKKKAKVRHNAYLYQGFKQFTANVKTSTHCIFVYGHSMAENDDHILKRIGKGKCKKLYVSLYGDPTNPINQKIISRAQSLAALRNDRHPLSVAFYDAQSADVWE